MMRVLSRATCLGAAAWLLSASLAMAAPARLGASASLDSFPNAPDAILWPPHPCTENDVIIYVRGYQSTPCDSFISAYRSGDREITIRTLMASNRLCGVGPSVFFAVRIPFGQLPAGAQAITLSRHVLSWDGSAVQDSTVTKTQLDFSVADACPDPPPPFPAADLPYVDSVATVPSPACPDRPVLVQFRGHFQDGCGRLVSATLEGGIHLVLAPHPNPSAPCPALLGPWSAQVSIGKVIPGSHSVLVEETVQGSDAVWPPVVDAEYVGLFDFTVAAECDSTLRPLPYVDHISIGSSDTSGIICANGPIQVRIGGQFPNLCWDVRRVQLLPGSPTPTVRVVLDDGGCKDMICPNVPVPWDTSVVLPGLPAGTYFQHVQVGLVTCSDSIPPDSLYSTYVPFLVLPAESCGVAPPPGFACLLPGWSYAGSGCNAYLGQGGSTSLSLMVASGAPLSGLQGELRFLQPGLLITSLEPDGPAVGMHLSWTATPTGARFVMFAEHGAPIPRSWIPGTPNIFPPYPVLKVGTAAAPIRIAWPENGFDLEAVSILGSDVNGVEVPSCPVVAFAPVIAHLCFERRCDFDGNGVADVRDLVRMVHCVNGDGPCPPDAATQFDCNGDAQFGLDDVLCCAIHLLQGPDCPDCPIDSTRQEPSVRATFEAPIVTAAGVDIPLRLYGSDRLGAARLALRFPSDRFTFAGAEAHDTSWLELHQGADGRASVGLIRVGPNIAVHDPQWMDVLLHLARKPGATVGGDISVESAEFSGPDGVMLRVDLATPTRALDGQAALTISGVRPNPSDGAFRISLVLTAPAQVDVAVLDLAGRRVATLLHGNQPAGSPVLVWDGRTSDGAPARGGVYFVRAAVGSRAAVKKLILLGSRGGYRLLSTSP